MHQQKNGFDSFEINLVVFNVIAETTLDLGHLLVSLKCSVLFVNILSRLAGRIMWK